MKYDMILDVKETCLSNGIRVVTAAIPRVQSIAVGIWVGVGGRYETKAVSGMSHFIEHLLFKGTSKLSAVDISRAIEGCGGYCNAFTHEEMTCYYAHVAYNHVWKVLNILCDMVLYPRFDTSDIKKERAVIIEEIMMYRDQPEHVVEEMLSSILWKGHPLSEPLAGTPESLSKINRKDILSFKQQKYVPRNTVFSFAGRINHEDAVAKVEKFMKSYPVSRKPVCQRITSSVSQERMILKSKDIEQTKLSIGFRTFGCFDKRRYALKVLSVILGENMSSRLFQVVREKHGLAYSVHSSSQLFADTGVLVVSAGLDNAKRHKALNLILREICRLKQKPVHSKELTRAKEYIVGHLRLAMENASGQMMWIGENILRYGSVISAEEVICAVNAVQPEDIQALAQKYFRKHHVSLAMLSVNMDRQDVDQIKSAFTTL